MTTGLGALFCRPGVPVVGTQPAWALPLAFKRAGDDSGPDAVMDRIALSHKARRSLLKSRQHILNEAESVLIALPEDIQERLGDTTDVRRRLSALAGLDRTGMTDPVVVLRREMLDQTAADVAEFDRRDKHATEALVEAGDPRRFTEGGDARFNGTAPLPASSGEGDSEPVRHRLNQQGNRATNAVLHRMAVTQLRCDPPARELYEKSPPQRPHQAGGDAGPQAPPEQRRPPTDARQLEHPQRTNRPSSRSRVT